MRTEPLMNFSYKQDKKGRNYPEIQISENAQNDNPSHKEDYFPLSLPVDPDKEKAILVHICSPAHTNYLLYEP